MRSEYFGIALALVAGVAAIPVEAQTTQTSSAVASADEKAFADELMRRLRANDYAGALDWLDARPDIAARPEGQKLRIQLLMFLDRDREAQALSEAYLSVHPDDATARFQLGEIHFRARQDQPAAFAYRLAVAGDLDETRRQAALARLTQIDGRKRWRFWVGGSVAPDSNLNSATDATRVDLFGLPFALSDDARRRSGVSVNAFGGVDRTVQLSPTLAVRLSAIGSLTDVPGEESDLQYLSLRAGPQWRLGPTTTVSVQVKQSRRWYGGAVWEDAQGFGLEGDTYGNNTRWTGAFNAEGIDAKVNPARNGRLFSIEGARTRYLGTSSLWRLGAVAVRREAESSTEAYTQGHISLGRLFQGPHATFIYAEASTGLRRYDVAAIAFGTRREDREASLELRLSKRDWFIWGAHPFVSMSTSRNRSTINIYTYDRTRMEFGFTREF
ncbi:surface lipoprotein assembly modifier [Asticcacaulis sp. BYS171W]|uniref:Surface lipoprotein assembly modifier n=1 Tax=Asticcacaulis aquaticus TaxID=2984212 RepID=A0ABT5HVA5_9CAUL|nr:surface lipoprotein assembly modifier [Asticcacaulis aquaticus]MDC7683984.1 surface lipoprotein assembly modifier [Asticcacaulis aquaticus]